MSRLYRAVEKADREGLVTWTRPRADREPPAPADGERSRDADVTPAAVAVALAPSPPPSPHEPETRAPAWEPSELPEPPTVWSAGLLSPLFVAATEPSSAAAEQYRMLRSRLETRDPARRLQLLVVTSPKLGDGKTTTSANLALTMAREFQHRVVLVEADLRRPTLAQRFGIDANRGLVDVLLGGMSLDEALVPVPGHQLTLLPGGAQASRSSELLASSMMRTMLDTLRRRFDRIVVDAPPVALADTHLLCRIADGVLVVVRAGVTPRPALERALVSIDRERIAGIVLNEVEDTQGDYDYAYAEHRYGDARV